MHPELVHALSEYRKVKNFQPESWIEDKCQKFLQYLHENELSGVVISVSGGIDSAVTLSLLNRCLKMDESPLKKVWAVAQPIHSSAWALERAKELCEGLGCKLMIVDQTKIHDQLIDMITEEVGGIEGKPYTTGQLRSYQRTPVNYYLAQLLRQDGFPAIVMGTGNQDEDGYLAYFCKAGDGVVDVQLISDLHKSEVFTIGKFLNVPESILKADPSADLWEGQTDEHELGISYDFIELFTGFYLKLKRKDQKKFKASLSPPAEKEFHSLSKKCRAIHSQNRHKLNYPENL